MDPSFSSLESAWNISALVSTKSIIEAGSSRRGWMEKGVDGRRSEGNGKRRKRTRWKCHQVLCLLVSPLQQMNLVAVCLHRPQNSKSPSWLRFRRGWGASEGCMKDVRRR